MNWWTIAKFTISVILIVAGMFNDDIKGCLILFSIAIVLQVSSYIDMAYYLLRDYMDRRFNELKKNKNETI